jgi:hypothetical protein
MVVDSGRLLRRRRGKRRVTALGGRVIPERTWRENTIALSVDDNNLLALEFENGTLATAVGSDCRGNNRIPWGMSPQ